MVIKDYPQPIEINGKKYDSRFYQLHDGMVVLKEVIPKIPQGKFDFSAEGKTVSAKFIADKVEDKESRPIPPYIAGDDIKEIVRLAQVLKRPVLIKGEPGSGKTQLSRAVAYEWYGDNYQQHYFEWFVKSPSKARDGLYSFDHVARLRDAQLAITNPELRDKPNTAYRKFGPMAMAFLTSTKENPSILLIDEIDKADIDFPNDLLLELEEKRFTIPEIETGEEILAVHPPVIFITSNDERELPEAFLRRCIFLYMKFPDDQQMRLIIKAHLPELVAEQEAFTQTVIERAGNPKGFEPKDFIYLAGKQFRVLKNKREKDVVDNKRVSTSELIDWLSAFYHDWKTKKGGFYTEIQGYISKYIRQQIKDKTEKLEKEDIKADREPEISEALKKFEEDSIANYDFYSQTVLKSFAAVADRSKLKEPLPDNAK